MRASLANFGVLVLLTWGGHALANEAWDSASEHERQLYIKYWQQDVHTYFNEVYIKCVRDVGIPNALEVGSKTFHDAELSIGKSCGSYISVLKGIIVKKGATRREASDLINLMYRGISPAVEDLFNYTIAERRKREESQVRIAILNSFKKDFSDCVSKKAANLALSSGDSAAAVADAAFGYCTDQKRAVEYAYHRVGNEEQVDLSQQMTSFLTETHDIAVALVFEARDQLRKRLQQSVDSPKPSERGI